MPKFSKTKAAKQNLSKSRLAAARGVDKPGDKTIIPVVQEELVISKCVVETGQGIRVTKTVSEREQVVDEPLAKDDVVIERVSVNKVIAAADIPGIRYEGETMIVPILEEILFVEKRTILKEELRISSVRREVRAPQRVVLRTEEVSVEPFDEHPEEAIESPG